MAYLDELDLPYQEHRGFLDSTIIVKIHNERHLRALRVFQSAFKAWQQRLQAIDDEIDREARLEQLARKNRWRRLTLRRPLKSLTDAK